MAYSDLFSADTGSFFRSPVRDIFKKVDLNSIYSFAGGYPSAETFPLDTFKRIMSDVTDRYGGQAFQYGATQGVTELRMALSARYGVPMERIQITSSSQQGIDVCTRIMVDPGDVILTSNPSYLGALQSFSSYRADIRGIAHDPDPEKFRAAYTEAIGAALSEGKKIKFLYMIPDFQNPSGETLSLEERRILVELARRYGFVIVEDSPYRELRYEGDQVPTMYSIDPDVVLHLGSFSKIMAPGFRLGWIFGNPELLDRIYVCKQSLDLCPPVFDQYVAAEFLSSGLLDKNLEKSIALYRDKRDLMLSMLSEHMPSQVTWTRPEGGLFLFLTLPETFDSVAFYDTALRNGVAYVAGAFFNTQWISGHRSPGHDGLNTMRMNFSFMSREKIRDGVVLLSGLLKDNL